ncbi:ty1-copia retrotransposon protein [Cucumis melo var. makuwa]|uniref:Ty1-copia retrotransposon protein n=1 Tax=Cucumis melo var. makuwa TaxID=1194695 RepID=A0A5A7V1N4_CUCMM|nr:ty1-copia retrotransposon protein [Cucumis melo var. makuwa]
MKEMMLDRKNTLLKVTAVSIDRQIGPSRIKGIRGKTHKRDSSRLLGTNQEEDASLLWLQKGRTQVTPKQSKERETKPVTNTSASRHFCTNRELLPTKILGECIFMGNSATTRVIGKGKTKLPMNSGKDMHQISPTLKFEDAWLRDAEFFEHVFPLKQSLSIPCLSRSMHDPESPSVVNEMLVFETVNTSNVGCELEPMKSKRQRTEKSFGPDFLSTFIVERHDEVDCNFTNLFLVDEDPKTYQETLNSVKSSVLKKAIKSELDSLTMNQTWVLVDLSMGNNDKVNSTSGYVFLLGGGAISWKSAKQTCIARSTMEFEFIALELARQGAAIGIAKSSVYNGKRRHIRLRHAAVKQLLKEGTISLEFVRSKKNLADPLAKGLTRKVVIDSLVNMGLKPSEIHNTWYWVVYCNRLDGP